MNILFTSVWKQFEVWEIQRWLISISDTGGSDREKTKYSWQKINLSMCKLLFFLNNYLLTEKLISLLLLEKHWDSRETKLTDSAGLFPLRPVIKVNHWSMVNKGFIMAQKRTFSCRTNAGKAEQAREDGLILPALVANHNA